LSLTMKNRFGYDDSLDAFGVHGVGGIIGTLATGLFAQKLINPSGADGLFFGNAKVFLTQVIGILVAMVYSFVLTALMLKVLDWTVGLRVSTEEEVEGLDLSQHGESGYTL
ncbi:MAG TPA: ammonia channel protein, partial [Thermodesulfovibrionales bacterium]|nr:ammonia channel protein [Thermodesulfovibrionales bacterium]